MIDEIGIVEILNKRLGIDPREKVSTGVIVKAMLLNGLGFVTAPLYLFGQFFQRHRQKSQQDLHQLSAIEFACIADATAAAHKLSEQMTWHQLTELEIVEKTTMTNLANRNQMLSPRELVSELLPRSLGSIV